MLDPSPFKSFRVEVAEGQTRAFIREGALIHFIANLCRQ
jgi:hypothetical protein